MNNLCKVRSLVQCRKCFYLTPKYISPCCQNCKLKWGKHSLNKTHKVDFNLIKDKQLVKVGLIKL